MTEITIIIPVLNRPGNAAPLVDSIERSTWNSHRILFVCSPGDDAQIEAVGKTGASMMIVNWKPGMSDYARKINAAARRSRSRWIFQGADDLRFHQNWDANALECSRHSGARVIGTADLGNPEAKRKRNFATHNLVARSYIQEHGTIERPGYLLHEGYAHNFCDRELAETAAARGEWCYCEDAVVEHRHPHWGKSEMDDTYTKGLKHFHSDGALFRSRRVLWTSA